MEDLLRLASQAAKQNINWDGIGNALSSFVIPMSRTEQNPAFHAEGDVWTHTKMVCEELVQLESYRKLSEEGQQAVFLAALLHDIGKIPTTRWEDGKWTSPNHSLVGSQMARQFLWHDMDLCGTPEKQRLRETVCLLLRYHSFPPHAIDDPDGKRKLMAIAANGLLCPLFTIELLCVLSEADALGRLCADRHDRIRMAEQVQLCRAFAQESGCYTGPFQFPSPHTRYAYLEGKNIAPEAELYDDTWGEVILMSGLPGTGKDTWIKEHYPQLPMISLDEIRREMKISPTDNQSKVVEIARERARDLLRGKQSFVWNATNISASVRRKQIGLFTQYRAATRIVYLETHWQEQLRRNAGREAAVPEQVICRMLETLVLPEVREAHGAEWICT
ncbi:MAG: AAA family ATPase [Oscillospiraceae bacterium]|nr:AAA family ATPase [Oscillospiraceae bacterium]